jgi:hypothetical protein
MLKINKFLNKKITRKVGEKKRKRNFAYNYDRTEGVFLVIDY